MLRKEYAYKMESVSARKKKKDKRKLSQSVSRERIVFSINGAASIG